MAVIPEAATESTVSTKKLRVKILAKKPFSGASELSRASDVHYVKKPSTIDKPKSSLGTKRVICQKSSVTLNRLTSVIGNTKLNSVAGCKRKSEEVLYSHERKRLKMNHLTTTNCLQVLTMLMNDERSFLFRAPVKPDEWGNIDDYFDIVKNPMDLGTVKQKLLQKTYIGIEEFEADVRLTFSNAMLYNPPHNWVHKSAKELSLVFDRHWKAVKMRMCREHNDVMQQKDVKLRGLGSNQDKITCEVKAKCVVSNSSNTSQLPRNTMPQKQKGSEYLKKQSFDRSKLCDSKVLKDGKPKDSLSFVDKEHDLAGFPTSTRSLGTSTCSLGTTTCSLDATTCSLGASTTAKGLETVLDVKLSPTKALHVVKLKSRFADTILKAQHHTLFEQSGGKNTINWQQEKKILESRQQEEEAKIEAKIRAAESAARLKVESERKRQRQEAREAARMALAEMEQSVEIVDNLVVLKDLEALIGTSLVVMRHDRRSRATVMWNQLESEKLRSPLERLGLYIKEEYMVGDDDDFDWEEGEVID